MQTSSSPTTDLQMQTRARSRRRSMRRMTRMVSPRILWLGHTGGNCALPAAGPNVIAVYIPTVTLTTIDNYWYGPNAAADCEHDCHFGDRPGHDAPSRAHRRSDAGDGECVSLVLCLGRNGTARGFADDRQCRAAGRLRQGGDSGNGGGGAGMGGAIFNQAACRSGTRR